MPFDRPIERERETERPFRPGEEKLWNILWT
jgi:hypothetical protein